MKTNNSTSKRSPTQQPPLTSPTPTTPPHTPLSTLPPTSLTPTSPPSLSHLSSCSPRSTQPITSQPPQQTGSQQTPQHRPAGTQTSTQQEAPTSHKAAPAAKARTDQVTEEHQTPQPIRQWESLLKELPQTPIATQLLNQWGHQVWQHLEKLLQRHPFLQDRPTFPERYTHALWHLIIKTAQQNNALPPVSIYELSQQLQLPHGTLHSWLTTPKQASIIESITILDQAHHQHNAQLPAEVHIHLIHPTRVYYAFKPFHAQPSEHITPQALAGAIQQLHDTIPNPPSVLIAELRPYHDNGGPQWLRPLAKTIRKYQAEIEQHLKPLGSNHTLHIAIANNTLYIWRRNNDPDNWLNIYNHTLFYTKEKDQLVNKANQHLNIRDLSLSRIIKQITNHPTQSTYPKGRLAALRHYHQYLLGESLHFLFDATNQILQDIHIDAIGRGSQGYGRIYNPRFPTKEEIAEFRARTLAIMFSDGHLTEKYVLKYDETETDRVQYVKALFHTFFGDIEDNQIRPRMRITRHRFPAVIGRILEKWGLPKGDKLLRNLHIPETVKSGDVRVRCAYLEEVIPEEGCLVITRSGRRGQYKIGRTAILDAGPKTQRYQFTPKITPIQKETLRHIMKTYYPQNRIGGIIRSKGYYLNLGDLKALAQETKDSHLKEQTEQLIQLILNNPPKLLTDEKELAENLGIKTRIATKRICLYESGRVSVGWGITTRSKDDAIRWALLAPPASGRKRRSTQQWLKANRDDAIRVRNQLLKEGLEPVLQLN